MIAVPLLFGHLTAADYEDHVAVDPRIDALRAKMQTERWSRSPETTTIRRSARSPNTIRIELNDGTVLEETVEYPIGHRRRRGDGIPLLEAKFGKNLARKISGQAAGQDP